MNTVEIHEITQYAQSKLFSVVETASFLNLFYPEIVNEFLEAYTLDYTDLEMIVEMINELKLPFIQVTETMNDGVKVHGFIKQGCAA